MKCRCKFIVTSVTRNKNSKADEGSTSIRLAAVTGGSDENKTFWKWTPCGSIDFSCVNPAAVEMFQPGEEFYVDFTKAE